MRDVHRVVAGNMREHDRKFLAADAADQIASAQFLMADFDAGFQHQIADGMTVFVVDGLEVVEIENDATQRMRVAPGQREGAVGLLPERLPRQRAGHAVAQHQCAQFEFAHHDRGEIRQCSCVIVAERARLRIHRAQRADGGAVRGAQLHAGIETQIRRTHDERVVLEAIVGQRIGDHKGVAALNGQIAEGRPLFGFAG